MIGFRNKIRGWHWSSQGKSLFFCHWRYGISDQVDFQSGGGSKSWSRRSNWTRSMLPPLQFSRLPRLSRIPAARNRAAPVGRLSGLDEIVRNRRDSELSLCHTTRRANVGECWVALCQTRSAREPTQKGRQIGKSDKIRPNDQYFSRIAPLREDSFPFRPAKSPSI